MYLKIHIIYLSETTTFFIYFNDNEMISESVGLKATYT